MKITTTSILELINKSEEELSEVGLDSQTLLDIYLDFISRQNELKSIAEMISNTMMSFDRVHSVRHRIKDPVHLLKKIIRKKKDDSERTINADNYLDEITDLVGVRALHLYKEAGNIIGESIRDIWKLKEDPISYIRTGDNDFYTKLVEGKGYQVKKHSAGYRSLHFIIATEPNKQKYFIEIQVRTIFEEGWSEIDHSIRYPNNTDNELINSILQILNRLSGSADELGTYIRKLDSEILKSEHNFKMSIRERDNKIEELQKAVNSLSIKDPERASINSKIEDVISTQRKFANNLEFLLNPPGIVAAVEAMKAMGGPSEAFANFSKTNEVLLKGLKDASVSAKSGSRSPIKMKKRKGTPDKKD